MGWLETEEGHTWAIANINNTTLVPFGSSDRKRLFDELHELEEKMESQLSEKQKGKRKTQPKLISNTIEVDITKKRALLAPIRNVPVEIIYQILGRIQVSWPGNVGQLVNISLVSKEWNACVHRSPRFWTVIRKRHPKGIPSAYRRKWTLNHDWSDRAAKWISHSGSLPIYVDVDFFDTYSLKFFAKFLENNLIRCQSLSFYVFLWDCYDAIEFNRDINMRSILKLLMEPENIKCLRSLSVPSLLDGQGRLLKMDLRNLTTLKMQHISKEALLALDIPLLRELRVNLTDLWDGFLQFIQMKFPLLNSFGFGSSSRVRGPWKEFGMISPGSFSDLTEFISIGNPNNVVLLVLLNSPALSHLEFINQGPPDPTAILLPHVTHLSVERDRLGYSASGWRAKIKGELGWWHVFPNLSHLTLEVDVMDAELILRELIDPSSSTSSPDERLPRLTAITIICKDRDKMSHTSLIALQRWAWSRSFAPNGDIDPENPKLPSCSITLLDWSTKGANIYDANYEKICDATGYLFTPGEEEGEDDSDSEDDDSDYF